MPQGSVLGPLCSYYTLTILIILQNIFDFHLFADDSNLFYANKNLNDLESVVNEELKHVALWLHANKL